MSDILINFTAQNKHKRDGTSQESCNSPSSVVYIEPKSFDGEIKRSNSIACIGHYHSIHSHKKHKQVKSEKQKKAEYFLSHIPMGGEAQIVSPEDDIEEINKVENTVSGEQNYEFKGIDVILHYKTQLKSGLYVLSPKKHFPLCVTSIIGMDDNDDKDEVMSDSSDSEDEVIHKIIKSVRKNKEPSKILNVSYRDLLNSFTAENTDNIYLDNAYIQQSSQTSIFFFRGWISSVIPYIKEKELKKELNKVFQDNYPDIPSSFTLSKLRKIKHLALMLCAPNITYPLIHKSLQNQEVVEYDIGTLALAFCYFERLVLYGHVDKENRKVICADCCLIAYKFNQISEVEGSIKTTRIRVLLNELTTLFGVSSDEVLENETQTLALLKFSLLTPYDQYIEHIFWILRKLDSEEMYECYNKAIHYDEDELGNENEEEVDSVDNEEEGNGEQSIIKEEDIEIEVETNEEGDKLDEKKDETDDITSEVIHIETDEEKDDEVDEEKKDETIEEKKDEVDEEKKNETDEEKKDETIEEKKDETIEEKKDEVEEKDNEVDEEKKNETDEEQKEINITSTEINN